MDFIESVKTSGVAYENPVTDIARTNPKLEFVECFIVDAMTWIPVNICYTPGYWLCIYDMNRQFMRVSVAMHASKSLENVRDILAYDNARYIGEATIISFAWWLSQHSPDEHLPKFIDIEPVRMHLIALEKSPKSVSQE